MDIKKLRHAQKIARKYGKSSDIYMVRILGAKPKDNKEKYRRYG